VGVRERRIAEYDRIRTLAPQHEALYRYATAIDALGGYGHVLYEQAQLRPVPLDARYRRRPAAGRLEGYDAGAAILQDFFRKELQGFLTSDLVPLGRKIIKACLEGCPVEEYAKILPMEYQYSFLSINDFEDKQ